MKWLSGGLAVLCLSLTCATEVVAADVAGPGAKVAAATGPAAVNHAGTRQPGTDQTAKPLAASIRLQTDVITGSSELPKVLYIVPWRAAGSASGLDAAPELGDQQLFQSLDPDAHGRLLHYRHLLGETVAEVK